LLIVKHGTTIIIPSYEGWPLLHRTLAAVLHDVRSDAIPWQVIVADNGSRREHRQRIRALARPDEPFEVIRCDPRPGRPFQPGAARNAGIERARYEALVFLDADCVPAQGLLERYHRLVAAFPGTVFLGHRVFVDASRLTPEQIGGERPALEALPRVASRSNYGQPVDRRLGELQALDRHPRPYDCLFGCNFALHRDCLGALRFDSAYDGYWGYEDIDLGYRLHRAGRQFRYVPEARVFHQESSDLGDAERADGRRRNIRVLERRVPGFTAYRAASGRIGSTWTEAP
jgi:GT2 family glycosyltransferase